MFELGTESSAQEKPMETGWRRFRVPSSLVALVLVSVVTAACSSSPSTPPATQSLNTSGMGNKVLPPVSVVANATVSWRFNCQNPSTRRSFVVTSTKSGGTAVTISRQVGLAGGGYKPFKTSGTYTLSVVTTCSWSIATGGSKPVTPGVPTTLVSE